MSPVSQEVRTVSASRSQDFSRRLLRGFAKPAAVLLRHPATTVFLGIGLFVVGIIELLEGIYVGFKTIVETHHGFVLFGLVTALRGLMELLESAEFFVINETEIESREVEHVAVRSEPPAGGSA
jgi:hypothetical protein